MEVWAEDGLPGGVQQPESRVETTEGRNRRDLVLEEPGGTHAASMLGAHSGADRERSHGGGRAADSRGLTDGGGADGGGARGGYREPMSQDPEGQSGADGRS